ncbi:hypothetical protein CMP1-34 [Clavibacter phage CMP1]|uniref:Uncharacterized protein n=1 Tax=Clavibacter phage CMP1 TaxID=686439 RepID=D0U218_9CAUD|nr:hypothetical protein CMP1-34 [Clavibacter phage CMP1]ACY35930.1 hypothetical protein CMP1-34 [Clavibacter phage CMP1]
MTYPPMNLGAATKWGRQIQKDLEDLIRQYNREKNDTLNANKGQNSSARSIGRQIQDLQTQARELQSALVILENQQQDLETQQTYLNSLWTRNIFIDSNVTPDVLNGEGWITDPILAITEKISTRYVSVTVSGTIRSPGMTGAISFSVTDSAGNIVRTRDYNRALRATNNSLSASYTIALSVPKADEVYTFTPEYYYFQPEGRPNPEKILFQYRSLQVQVLSTKKS